MRLEVTVDNEDPKVYPLDRAKIVIGSHESCDIIISSTNVSRKHLVVISQDDHFYVSDQGSTNGSFLNEQRLVPGVRTEFSSFFPVRLGTNVLISLLSDEEAEDVEVSSLNNFQAPKVEEAPPAPETTRMISLKDLNKGSTAGLVKQRNQTVEKRKVATKSKQPAKKKKESNLMAKGLFFLAIFIGAAYYNLKVTKEKEELAEQEKVSAAQVKKVVVNKPTFSGPIKRIDETQLQSAETILSFRNEPKCVQEADKYICVTLPNVYQGKFGAVSKDKMLYIYADGNKYQQLAKQYVKTEQISELQLLMVAMWVQDNFPAGLTKFDGVKDRDITIAFVNMDKPEGELITAAFFVPESLYRLSLDIQPQHFEAAKKDGHLAFSYILDYLRFI